MCVVACLEVVDSEVVAHELHADAVVNEDAILQVVEQSQSQTAYSQSMEII